MSLFTASRSLYNTAEFCHLSKMSKTLLKLDYCSWLLVLLRVNILNFGKGLVKYQSILLIACIQEHLHVSTCSYAFVQALVLIF